jgi:hypothetical protein
MSYLVGGGLASNYDIMAISDGLEHLPTRADFEVGQAVQFVLPLPGGIPAGAVAITATVRSTSQGRKSVCTASHALCFSAR